MSQEPTVSATTRRSGEGGPASPRVEVRRHAERARYDRATIDAILDEALICHLGVVVDGEPLVLPTGFGRLGDILYLHGAAANRSLAAALEGACVTVTHLDGLVLARSASGHSMNYRSVVVRGRARAVTDPVERRDGLRAVVEHALPGRWDEVRQPSPREMDATAVIALDLAECSAKVRSGPPLDPASDRPPGIWAGEVPLRMVAGAPRPDPDLGEGVVEAPSVGRMRRRFPALPDGGG
ncbi:MAG: pyridoxamine 5'-phosphate oxidase family protein [Candidatus Dormiibacterota bacterium]|jgi:nitroimidazol reductase NimA-like FMN-containing flavoprotein (pyridoxamine 5'-phosphate oxidase superfamily)